jgi:hypothetical protein
MSLDWSHQLASEATPENARDEVATHH